MSCLVVLARFFSGSGTDLSRAAYHCTLSGCVNPITHSFIPVFVTGAFMPRCDETGYYQKEQCHSGTGYCWCVDLNGNEIPNTRAMKKAHCGEYWGERVM